MASSRRGTEPPEPPVGGLGRAPFKKHAKGRRWSDRLGHPGGSCLLGDLECRIVSLKDATSPGGLLERLADGSDTDDYAVAGHIAIDSEPYVVLLKKGASKLPEAPPRKCLRSALTDREWEIASLVAEGKVNKQIAYQLKISEWTVSTHIRRIFVKLGVSSRASMVALLMSSDR